MSHESAPLERGRFVDDLLCYMTLGEKLGQLDLFHRPDDPALEASIAAGSVGGVVGGNAPDRLQVIATERSRLGIPLLLIQASVEHKLSPWALAASWDEDLAQAAGAAAARDAIGSGFNCIAAPGMGAAPTAGEPGSQIAGSDPHLATRLANAFARGAATDGAEPRGAVLAIPAWRSTPDRDGLAWSLAVVQAGDAHALDCEALDRTTAQRAGFSGVLVAECRRITSLVERHFATTSARSLVEAAERVIARGVVSEFEIDMATRGVLTTKHALGLFRDPQRIIAPPASGDGADRNDHLVRGTFVLLRNEAGLLPLSPVSDKVLVVGSTAGAAGACANALARAGIGHSIAPGLAQRQAGESWDMSVPGDHFALSLTSDAARRADFVLVVLEDRHFGPRPASGWRRPTAVMLTLLRGLSLSGTRLVAILATPEPVELGDADQYFAAVLQTWQPVAGFEEALSDVLSGRFSPQGRMPTSAGRFLFGHGLGFGESVISAYSLTAKDTCVEAMVQVRNSGAFKMRETVQVYERTQDSATRLIAFDHVTLAPGESKTVSFDLAIDALGTPGASNLLELAPGRYEILVGKSRGKLLSATVEITPAMARALTLKERRFLKLASG